MKSVGKLHEFIQSQNLDSASWYVYRQCKVAGDQNIVEQDKPDAHKSDGLLLLMPGQGATTLPKYLVYRAEAGLNSVLEEVAGSEPDFRSMSDDKAIQYQLWRIEDLNKLPALQNQLDKMPAMYPLQNWVTPQHDVSPVDLPGEQNDGSVMSVLLFAHDQLQPLPCHRLLADLAGMDDYGFLQRLQKSFNIRVASGPADATPHSAREFGLYVAGYWYHLKLIEGTWFHADPVSDLDVSVVHDNMIAPMLGITERQDKRIAYTGPDCSLAMLRQQVDSGRWQAAWLMPAPSIEDMMRISDLGRVMPAHSVCFRPLIAPAVLATAVLTEADR
ncbi:MAG: DUF1015 family protein [Pseudohongiella sp.]|nr:DUF1015 family protein [Pseudohongiella sp.]